MLKKGTIIKSNSGRDYIVTQEEKENRVGVSSDLVIPGKGHIIDVSLFRPDCRRECPFDGDHQETLCYYAHNGGNCHLCNGYVPEESTPKKGDVIRNFTPHPITLEGHGTWQSEGLARVAEKTLEIEGFFPCVRKTYTKIEGLPEPVRGTWFIVSLVVFQNSDRTDLLCPDTGQESAIGDGKGRIIAVKRFMVR